MVNRTIFPNCPDKLGLSIYYNLDGTIRRARFLTKSQTRGLHLGAYEQESLAKILSERRPDEIYIQDADALFIKKSSKLTMELSSEFKKPFEYLTYALVEK